MPQEDGRDGEGGTADNIGGEVGSILPYPTFTPPGPKSRKVENKKSKLDGVGPVDNRPSTD